MTAIKEFERLESLGLWRDSKDSQRREVIVSFGESTLVLSDINNRPITHWSLAAIEDAGNSENGTIFTVDDLGEETLEIDDQIMISAIDKIKASIEARRPHPGRLRLYFRNFNNVFNNIHFLATQCFDTICIKHCSRF